MIAYHDQCEVPYCSRACMDQVIAEGLCSAKEFDIQAERSAAADPPSAAAMGSGGQAKKIAELRKWLHQDS